MRGLYALFLIVAATANAAAVPQSAAAFVKGMGKGWNLGNSLDSYKEDDPSKSDETSWENPVVTKELLQKVKALGFKTIRVPVTYATRFEDDDVTIKEEWLNRVEEVIDWALELDFYVITNLHHDSRSWADFSNSVKLEERQAKFIKVWAQIAARLAKKSHNLIFEPLNEPVGDTATVAPQYNKVFKEWAAMIRKSGGLNSNRHITVPCMRSYWWFLQFFDFVDPADNWSVHIHLYDPYAFLFGAYGVTEWGFDSDKQSILDTFEKATKINPAVIVGEYAVVVTDDLPRRAARRKWYAYHNTLFEKYGIAATIWDGGDILDRKTLSWRDPDYSLAPIMQPNSAVVDVGTIYVKHKSKVATSHDLIFGTNAKMLTDPSRPRKNQITKVTPSLGLPTHESSFNEVLGKSHFTIPQSVLQSAADQAATGKTGYTFEFETGAPLTVPLVVYDTPTTTEKTIKISLADQAKTPKGSYLDIPIDFKSSELAGVRGIRLPADGIKAVTAANIQCAAVGSFPSNQVDPTAGTGPDHRCFMVWGVEKHFILDEKHLKITKDFLDKQTAGDVLLTLDFFPRHTGNQLEITLSFS